MEISDQSSLWREIATTRLSKPALRPPRSNMSNDRMTVPAWMSDAHRHKLSILLSWLIPGAPIRQIPLDSEEPPAVDDLLARISKGLVHHLVAASPAVRAELENPAQVSAKFENKLYKVAAVLPVSDPVYAVDVISALIENPDADPAAVGTRLLVEHVETAVAAACRRDVFDLLSAALNGKCSVFFIPDREAALLGANEIVRTSLGSMALSKTTARQVMTIDSPCINFHISMP